MRNLIETEKSKTLIYKGLERIVESNYFIPQLPQYKTDGYDRLDRKRDIQLESSDFLKHYLGDISQADLTFVYGLTHGQETLPVFDYPQNAVVGVCRTKVNEDLFCGILLLKEIGHLYTGFVLYSIGNQGYAIRNLENDRDIQFITHREDVSRIRDLEEVIVDYFITRP